MTRCAHVLLLVLSVCMVRGAHAAAEAPPILGLWETIDDETKTKKSVVELRIIDGVLTGCVRSLLDPHADQAAVCSACQGKQKGQPIVGLTIMWGLIASDAEGRAFDRGIVLDPHNGKEYRCRLRLLEDGRLEVRGYIGMPLLGRSQIWQRPRP